jgi:hypothetical protein
VFDERPLFVPIEWAAEFPVVTFHAIAAIKRAKGEMDRGVAFAFADVQAAGAVAAFATNLHKPCIHKFPAIARRAAETNCVAADAFWVVMGFMLDQCLECMRMR